MNTPQNFKHNASFQIFDVCEQNGTDRFCAPPLCSWRSMVFPARAMINHLPLKRDVAQVLVGMKQTGVKRKSASHIKRVPSMDR
jgi:hypothetical protein